MPWVLLMPAILALGLPLWAGYGVLWAGLGVGLGVAWLLVGQWGRWSMAARVGVSLCLALLGHGLALGGWLLSARSPLPFTAVTSSPKASVPYIPRGGSAALAPIFPSLMARPSLGPFGSSSAGGPPERELEPIGHLGALLAVTFSADKDGKGRAFATTAAGLLKQFSYPDFQLQATYRLDQPAYRAVPDRRRGMLWVAASAPGALRVSLHGDPPSGRGDLHLYDVASLTGNLQTETVLHPRRVLPLDGNVTELLSSPDQRRVFYLAQTDRGVHVGRIDADTEERDAELSLPPQTHALCLTPDGKTLYAAGAGVVSVIDSATLRVRQRVKVEGDIWSVTADNEGHVYVGRQGQWTEVTLLNLSGPQPSTHQWSATLHGRIYLKLSGDQQRLYASSSSVISNLIEALLVRGHNRIPPHQIAVIQPSSTASTLPNQERWVGGEFFLSTDGRFLVSCRGLVFRLASGTPLLPNSPPAGTPPLISRMRGGGPANSPR